MITNREIRDIYSIIRPKAAMLPKITKVLLLKIFDFLSGKDRIALAAASKKIRKEAIESIFKNHSEVEHLYQAKWIERYYFGAPEMVAARSYELEPLRLLKSVGLSNNLRALLHCVTLKSDPLNKSALKKLALLSLDDVVFPEAAVVRLSLSQKHQRAAASFDQLSFENLGNSSSRMFGPQIEYARALGLMGNSEERLQAVDDLLVVASDKYAWASDKLSVIQALLMLDSKSQLETQLNLTRLRVILPILRAIASQAADKHEKSRLGAFEAMKILLTMGLSSEEEIQAMLKTLRDIIVSKSESWNTKIAAVKVLMPLKLNIEKDIQAMVRRLIEGIAYYDAYHGEVTDRNRMIAFIQGLASNSTEDRKTVFAALWELASDPQGEEPGAKVEAMKCLLALDSNTKAQMQSLLPSLKAMLSSSFKEARQVEIIKILLALDVNSEEETQAMVAALMKIVAWADSDSGTEAEAMRALVTLSVHPKVDIQTMVSTLKIIVDKRSDWDFKVAAIKTLLAINSKVKIDIDVQAMVAILRALASVKCDWATATWVMARVEAIKILVARGSNSKEDIQDMVTTLRVIAAQDPSHRNDDFNLRVEATQLLVALDLNSQSEMEAMVEGLAFNFHHVEDRSLREKTINVLETLADKLDFVKIKRRLGVKYQLIFDPLFQQSIEHEKRSSAGIYHSKGMQAKNTESAVSKDNEIGLAFATFHLS